MDKNQIPADFADQSALASALLDQGDRSLLLQDVRGDYHFKGDFRNAEDLKAALEKLRAKGLAELVDREYDAYLEVFEQMFDHKAFTGRSGTFYGYEGLGSIYWHMVSKLLLATQEVIYAARDETEEIRGRLIEHYYEIRAGIGINKSPELYGAFPTDPYSHTPAHKGAQQPGMTGQVKEDILNRWAELGVQVDQGCVSFAPFFMHPSEFLEESSEFQYFNLEGHLETFSLQAGELGFTYCQVPVIYRKSDRHHIRLSTQEGEKEIAGVNLDKTLSTHLFNRDSFIQQIQVELPL
ncbi:MAG: hypothetical protein AAF804_16515 [Bacteroidota bacterium]